VLFVIIKIMVVLIRLLNDEDHNILKRLFIYISNRLCLNRYKLSLLL